MKDTVAYSIDRADVHIHETAILCGNDRYIKYTESIIDNDKFRISRPDDGLLHYSVDFKVTVGLNGMEHCSLKYIYIAVKGLYGLLRNHKEVVAVTPYFYKNKDTWTFHTRLDIGCNADRITKDTTVNITEKADLSDIIGIERFINKCGRDYALGVIRYLRWLYEAIKDTDYIKEKSLTDDRYILDSDVSCKTIIEVGSKLYRMKSACYICENSVIIGAYEYGIKLNKVAIYCSDLNLIANISDRTRRKLNLVGEETYTIRDAFYECEDYLMFY